MSISKDIDIKTLDAFYTLPDLKDNLMPMENLIEREGIEYCFDLESAEIPENLVTL